MAGARSPQEQLTQAHETISFLIDHVSELNAVIDLQGKLIDSHTLESTQSLFTNLLESINVNYFVKFFTHSEGNFEFYSNNLTESEELILKQLPPSDPIIQTNGEFIVRTDHLLVLIRQLDQKNREQRSRLKDVLILAITATNQRIDQIDNKQKNQKKYQESKRDLFSTLEKMLHQLNYELRNNHQAGQEIIRVFLSDITSVMSNAGVDKAMIQGVEAIANKALGKIDRTYYESIKLDGFVEQFEDDIDKIISELAQQ